MGFPAIAPAALAFQAAAPAGSEYLAKIQTPLGSGAGPEFTVRATPRTASGPSAPAPMASMLAAETSALTWLAAAVVVCMPKAAPDSQCGRPGTRNSPGLKAAGSRRCSATTQSAISIAASAGTKGLRDRLPTRATDSRARLALRDQV